MVMSEFDQYCTLLVHRSHHHYVQPSNSAAASIVAAASGRVQSTPAGADSGPFLPQQPQISDLQKRLENSKDSVKLQALKEVLLWVMAPGSIDVVTAASGGGFTGGANVASRLLMTIIRFVLPSSDHNVTKMLQLYWEMVDKTKPDGTLKEEMILVCNKLREDLLHPNEYVRGSTLRLLCKVRFVKILEPLVESIIQNLTHHHAYVRRNAIMCVYSMVRSFGTEILPHAAEEIQKLLLLESDLSTKRNAFLMLIHCDLARAVAYALSVQDNIGCLGDIFQLALLELLRRVSRENASQTSTLLRIIETLVDSCSPAVAYEGASALVALSSSPVALKAATRAYIGLVTWQADNTVKLIVLDRLKEILERHSSALEEFVIDILRSLSCPSLAVRKKALHIALRLVSPRTVHDVVSTLKKELVKTLSQDNLQDTNSTQHATYQRLLIQALRTSCKGHLEAAIPILPLLLDFLLHRRVSTATEVAMFVRELIVVHSEIRPALLPKLIESITEIPHCRVIRVCLWIIGEYCEDTELRQQALAALYEAVSPIPFPPEAAEKVPTEAVATDENRVSTAPERKMKVVTRTVVLPDGTYGTEDIYQVEDEGEAAKSSEVKTATKLRGLLLNGDFLLASLLAMTCTKLVVKTFSDVSEASTLPERDRAKCLLIVASLLKFCRQHSSCGPMGDATVRINQAFRVLSAIGDPKVRDVKAWFPESRTALKDVLESEEEAASYEAEGSANGTGIQLMPDVLSTEVKETVPDEGIVFRQLGIDQRPSTPAASLDDPEDDLNLAMGLSSQKEDSSIFQQRLARVQQMTGLADPVYVEAFLQVNQFDLIVELLVINRTPDTLQNVNVELCTHGDLKIVERPPPVTLSSGQSHTMHASVKVQSTETGIIFGHITFDKSSSMDKEYLVLNELHVDLLDFIQRSWISDLTFRSMWAEFEWENKITINTVNTNVRTFLERIMQQTNMTIVGRHLSVSQSDGSKKAHISHLRNRETSWNQIMVSDGRQENDYLEKIQQLPGLRRLMDNSSFFAVNLYSRSIFGEDALANVSIEKLPNGKLAGNVRIRSRNQGIALSLGDRVTVVQRGLLR